MKKVLLFFAVICSSAITVEAFANVPFVLSDTISVADATNVGIHQISSIRVNYDNPLTGVNWAGITLKAQGDAITNYFNNVVLTNPDPATPPGNPFEAPKPSSDINYSTISIYPISAGMPYNTLMTVTIPAAAIPAQGGYELTNNITWSFTTEKAPIVPIAVSTYSPAIGATGVASNAPVKVTLNNNVNTNAAPNFTNNVTVNGTVVPVTASGTGITVSHAAFVPSTTYTVLIKKEAVTGLAADITWSFTSAAINVSNYFPTSGSQGVSVNENLRIVFNYPINTYGEPDFSGITISGSTVENVTYDRNIITIKHSEFDVNSYHTVTIPAGTIQGYNQAIEWSFLVSSVIDSCD